MEEIEMKDLKEIMNGKYGYTDWLGTKLALLEDSYLDNVPYGGEIIAGYVAHAVNASDKSDETVYLCIWPAKDGYNEPSDYIDWSKCDNAKKTSEVLDAVLA